MRASLLVSCVGVATRPGFCPIAKFGNNLVSRIGIFYKTIKHLVNFTENIGSILLRAIELQDSISVDNVTRNKIIDLRQQYSFLKNDTDVLLERTKLKIQNVQEICQMYQDREISFVDALEEVAFDFKSLETKLHEASKCHKKISLKLQELAEETQPNRSIGSGIRCAAEKGQLQSPSDIMMAGLFVMKNMFFGHYEELRDHIFEVKKGIDDANTHLVCIVAGLQELIEQQNKLEGHTEDTVRSKLFTNIEKECQSILKNVEGYEKKFFS
uniref:Uncharacterized protein n=1 Tax=Eptatretus burgeri TaxID=7764 RepID=A0A8C4QYX8_EPTBU